MKKKKIALSCNAIRLDRENITTEGEFLHIKGYACHFDKPNGNGEIVTKDSFDHWFEELGKSTVMPSINLMHSDRIIGGCDLLKPDDTGLWLEARICLTPFVKDEILPLIENGFLSHLSTEGLVLQWHYDENQQFIADEYLLRAVALVDVPADLNASFSTNSIALKRKNGMEEERPQQRDAKTVDII